MVILDFYNLDAFRVELLQYFLRNSVFNKGVYGEYKWENEFIPKEVSEGIDGVSFPY